MRRTLLLFVWNYGDFPMDTYCLQVGQSQSARKIYKIHNSKRHRNLETKRRSFKQI